MLEEPIRYRVQKDGTVPATCPACGAVHPIPANAFKSRAYPVEAQCDCGKSFPVFAEFRKAYRRQVSLQGTYTPLSSDNEPGPIQVKNLSMTGIGFQADDNCLSPSDELRLRMVFDKGEHPDLELAAEVVHVSNGYAGCQFKDMSPDQVEILASYLILIP